MRPLNILVADDKVIIRLGLKAVLAELGHEVALASDGREALKLAHQRLFDLAIFDIKMPFTDGLEAARALHRYRPTPTLLLTAFGEQDLIERAAQLPIQGYLIKPVQEAELAAAIEVAVRRFDEAQALAAKNAELEESMETRKLVECAKGILMKQGASEDEAYRQLQKSARDGQSTLRQAAEAVLRRAAK